MIRDTPSSTPPDALGRTATIGSIRPRSRRIGVAAAAGLAALVVGASAPSTTLAVGCGTASDFAGGTGLVGDPYLVSTPTQLLAINNSSNLACDYLVTADLDLSGDDPWTPIGAEGTEFTGSFDGGGHTISGLSIINTSNDQPRGMGIFGRVIGATLENVVIDGATIVAQKQNGFSSGQVGALVGRAEQTTIRDVTLNGTVRITSYGNMGGVVGYGQAMVLERIRVDADLVFVVVNNGDGKIGGIVGNLTTEYQSQEVNTATDMVMTGMTIEADPTTNTSTNRIQDTGGLFGSMNATTLRNGISENLRITLAGTPRRLDYSGGATGYMFGGLMERVTVTGLSIEGGPGADSALGGLIGQIQPDSNDNSSIIRWSRADGSIGADTDDEVGGMVGQIFSDFLIEDTYTTVDVAGSNLIGGAIGDVYDGDATILRTYAAGSVTGTGAEVGGFIGQFNGAGTVQADFWDTETSGQPTSASGATGRTTAQMQSITNFTDAEWGIVSGWQPFDPDNSVVWGICNDYPYLLWEGTSSEENPCVPEPPVLSDPTFDGSDATFTWAPGGGRAATSYSVVLSPGGASCEVTAPETSCTISGLQPGTTYTATATATNEYGTSIESDPIEFTTDPPATTTTAPSTTLPTSTVPGTDPTTPTTPTTTLDGGPSEGVLPPTGSSSTMFGAMVAGFLLLAGLTLRALRRPVGQAD